MIQTYKDVEEMLESFIEDLKNGVDTDINLHEEVETLKEEIPICW